MTAFGFAGSILLACWFTAHNKWRIFHILCLSVKNSMLTVVLLTSVATQGFRSRRILFVEHLARGWHGVTVFQEPVARSLLSTTLSKRLSSQLWLALPGISMVIFLIVSWQESQSLHRGFQERADASLRTSICGSQIMTKKVLAISKKVMS